MATATQSPIECFLRSLSSTHVTHLSDQSLLERFSKSRETVAFTALVERHGTMVFNVCRRILHQFSDAEDAFQATFLILARKAGSLKNPEALSAWLHGVAYRVAKKARTRVTTKRTREQPIGERIDAENKSRFECEESELREMLDHEIDRLPQKYRDAFVLCYLENKTNKEAARQLGCPLGTIYSRLAWARDRIRERLLRRGLTVTALSVAALVNRASRAASLPPTLAAPTVNVACVYARNAATDAVSSSVRSLISYSEKTIPWAKLGACCLLLTGVVLFAVGGGSSVFETGNRGAQRNAGKKRPPVIGGLQEKKIDKVTVKLRQTLRHDDWVRAVAFSPNGRVIASAGFDKTVRLWEVATGKLISTLEGHTKYVDCLAFSPNGEHLVSGSWDDTARLWSVKTGKALRMWKTPNDVNSIAFSPDGRIVAAGVGDKTIILWDAATGKQLSKLAGHISRVYGIAFSPDGKILASCSGEDGVNKSEVFLWNVQTGKKTAALQGHTDGGVFDVTFSRDSRLLASCGRDGIVNIWDVKKRKLRKKLDGHDQEDRHVYSVAFSPDGRLLASSGKDKSVRIWNVRSGKLMTSMDEFDRHVYSVAFSPDGRLLATGCADDTVRLWSLKVK